MGVLLYTCCIFSENLLFRKPLEGCFWKFRQFVYICQQMFCTISYFPHTYCFSGVFSWLVKPKIIKYISLCLVFEIFFCFCWYICSVMPYMFFLYIWKEPFHCFRNLLLNIKYKSFVLRKSDCSRNNVFSLMLTFCNRNYVMDMKRGGLFS